MSVVLSVCTWHLSLPSQVKLGRGWLKPRGLRNKEDPLWNLGIVLDCCYSSFTHCLCERSREHCAWMKCARAKFFFAASAVHRDLYLHISVTPCEMPSCQVTRTSASPRLTMYTCVCVSMSLLWAYEGLAGVSPSNRTFTCQTCHLSSNNLNTEVIHLRRNNSCPRGWASLTVTRSGSQLSLCCCFCWVPLSPWCWAH